MGTLRQRAQREGSSSQPAAMAQKWWWGPVPQGHSRSPSEGVSDWHAANTQRRTTGLAEGGAPSAAGAGGGGSARMRGAARLTELPWPP